MDRRTGEEIELPAFAGEAIAPDELIGNVAAAGGGYGDPLDRDPEAVRWDVREEWVSVEKARTVYGVVLDTQVEEYSVDAEATRKLRQQLKAQMEKGG